MTSPTLSYETALFLSHTNLKRRFEELIDDCPDVDDAGFYISAKDQGLRLMPDGEGGQRPKSHYGGWRAQMDPKAIAHLRGFRQGLEHAKKVIASGGGAAWAGIVGMVPQAEVLSVIANPDDAPEGAVSDEGMVDLSAILGENPEQVISLEDAYDLALKLAGSARLASFIRMDNERADAQAKARQEEEKLLDAASED